MDKEKEYIKHIKQRWNFAKKVSEEELQLTNHVGTNVSLSIFDKTVSPYHYFLVDGETSKDEPATEKQIKYAKSLKIENPEKYTKKELSKKIDEVK